MTTASRRGRAYALWIASAASAALAMTSSAGLTGCAQPRLDIQARPGVATIYLDGNQIGQPDVDDSPDAPNYRRVGQDASMRLPYYGSTLLTGAVPDSLEWQRAQRLAPVDEPFSPWLFPFDFILELTTYPFQNDRYRHRLELRLQPQPRTPVGVRPPTIPVLHRRAQAAREER